MTSTTPTIPGLAAMLIAELADEAAKTRTVLERVPESQLHWRPHPKSMSLGQLALHLALLPLGIAMLADPLVSQVPDVPLNDPASRGEVLAALEQGVAVATEKLEGWGDEGLAAQWTLVSGEAALVAMPRGDLLRALMFNHVYHHRGQLTVYLRLLDVPVPPLYGPTADENPFA